MNASHQATASAFVGRLGAILIRHGIPLGETGYVPGVFDAALIRQLPLPLRENRAAHQTVALVDGPEFHREFEDSAVSAAYVGRPRTRVLESVHTTHDWYGLVALGLASLSRLQVICTLYESSGGDATLGAHEDEWDGVIIQMRGQKAWSIEGADVEQKVLTREGDVLLLPRNVTHAVATPEYSVHLVCALTEPLGQALTIAA